MYNRQSSVSIWVSEEASVRSFNPLLTFGLAVAPVLFASTCVPDTLANYEALGSAGCTNGIFDVKDFTFTLLASTVPIEASDITVTPSLGSNAFGLDFTSPKFNVSGPNLIEFQIGYFWDPGDIRSADEVMNDPVLPPGLSQLTVLGCENANFTGLVCPTTPFMLVLAATNPTETTVTASQPFTPGTVTTVGYLDTVLLAGNGSGSADIVDFKDSLTTVPEPSTLILVLLPLGAGVVRRFRRRLHFH